MSRTRNRFGGRCFFNSQPSGFFCADPDFRPDFAERVARFLLPKLRALIVSNESPARIPASRWSCRAFQKSIPTRSKSSSNGRSRAVSSPAPGVIRLCRNSPARAPACPASGSPAPCASAEQNKFVNADRIRVGGNFFRAREMNLRDQIERRRGLSRGIFAAQMAQPATATANAAQDKIKNNFFIRGFSVPNARPICKRKHILIAPICKSGFHSPCLNSRIFLRYWLPVLIWMAVIFTASSDAKSYEHSSRLLAPLLRWLFPQMSEDNRESRSFFSPANAAHLTEYAVFALLVWRALNQSKNNLAPWSWPKVGGTLLIVFLYASSDEFHQIFVPTRTPRIHDVVIDTIGGAIGLLALWIFRSPAKTLRKNKNETPARRRRFMLRNRLAARGNFSAAARRFIFNLIFCPRSRPCPQKIPAGFDLHRCSRLPAGQI